MPLSFFLQNPARYSLLHLSHHPPFLSELGTCISIGVASSEPACRGAPNRTGENTGPPNPICHKDPSGNKGEEGSLSPASPGEPQQVCKEPGELCHQVESPTSRASRAALPHQPLRQQASEQPPEPRCFGPQGCVSNQHKETHENSHALGLFHNYYYNDLQKMCFSGNCDKLLYVCGRGRWGSWP